MEVDDVENEYARLQNAGVDIYYPLTTEEWGQTHFCLRDPSGVTIDIVKQVT
ncbi:MAG: VOC family protein [Neisseria sp.]|uniref:VOC family protein n=1 Tax=Neisseria sp. TaxID=192066 RepID=UPI0026DCD171|nr:VOC family protein [Neisseria sp.]MDO4641249.1 VOC family protein [Neisseria sp.]